MSDFTPRAYQLELYEHAKKQNSVLVLGTGSGKTFISILLIKDLGHQIRSHKEDRKWTVFVVNTVPLVYQQGEAIKQHTPFSVGLYESSVGVDYWTEDKWEEELEKHEVLVIVAQIFQDLLNFSCLSLEKINLLIFDECHHATGRHPMREIMRRFNSQRENKPNASFPRVVGLTASAINKRCRWDEVEPVIKELEATLHSTLVTSVDIRAVKQHSTAPKEAIVSFSVSEDTEHLENIAGQLAGIQCDLDEWPDVDESCRKPLKKKLVNITQIMRHLGDWFGTLAVKYEMENFEEAEDNEEVPALRELKKLLCQRLELIYKYCRQREEQIHNPLSHITKKVQKLLDLLSHCKDDKYGLIFVERRNTAKVLYEFLKQISLVNDNFSFIKPAFLVGSNAYNPIDIRIIQEELKKQKETLASFARGDINFLISTSILEEGIDVRKCNIVIRFDEPKNYRAYVQSRGRARAIPSSYVFLAEENSVDILSSQIADYRRIEVALSTLCHNRQLPTDQETSAHFAEDEIVEPYQPYGHDGRRITFNSAIPLINVYCGQLPRDKFSELAPTYEYEERNGNEKTEVKAAIKLPINACLKTPVSGDWMDNKAYARKSAALALCIKLHEMKELNDHLRPVGKLDDTVLDDLVEIPPEVCTENGMHQAGTKKRRQIYRKEMCEALSFMSDSFKLYSITVQSIELPSNEISVDSGTKNVSVGLLCKQALRCPPFPLYSSKWNEVVVRIQLISEDMLLDFETFSNVRHFHKVVFKNLLGINQSLFDYSPQQTSLFILPLSGGRIDTSLLKHIASLDSLRIHKEINSHGAIFNFERAGFEDSIIYPLYRPMSEGMFYVVEIHDDMNPLDPFPESGKQFTSYEHYFLSEYGRRITNKSQPLISVKHLPKDLNFLKKGSTKQTKRKLRRDPPKYIPELCGILPLKASLWWQIMLLPSVLHRLNSLVVADELKRTFPHSSAVNKKSSEFNTIDFDWTKKFINRILQPPGSNLAVFLANATSEPIQSFMMLNAVTLVGANDNFDAERLEVLGDSFLKYVVAEYLFLKFTDDHEGNLSQKRSKLVCNRTLYSLAKAKQIPEKIQSTSLDPTLNGIMPGYVLKTDVEQKLRDMCVPHDLWARFGEITHEELQEEIRKRIEVSSVLSSCYNPWTEHELGDKSVADCVEALLGVFLLVGGNEAAISFLHNLGIGVSRGTSLFKMHFPVKSALLIDNEEAKEEILRYYEKSCLDNLEKKIHYSFNDKSLLVQAVTHSSYTHNRVTDCYQRLEFLGDAVLDYLVTGIIFTSDNNYKPGQLTDLRSYYVKNETLAKVSAKYDLQCHLLYMAPKLQGSIEKYLNLFHRGLNKEEELFTEDDEVALMELDVPKALGDLVEAIVGAVYLDSGRSLEKTWHVVKFLMDDIIKETLTDIPINCIRKLYEKVPAGVQFVKQDMKEDDTMAEYEVRVQGLPPLIGRGKNYKVAKIAGAKRALWMLKQKEKEEAQQAPQ